MLSTPTASASGRGRLAPRQGGQKSSVNSTTSASFRRHLSLSTASRGSSEPVTSKNTSKLTASTPLGRAPSSLLAERRRRVALKKSVTTFLSSESSDSVEPTLQAGATEKPWYTQLRDGTCHKRFRMIARKHRQMARGQLPHPYPRTRSAVKSRAFEAWLTAVIVLNCIFIGWQADLPADAEKAKGVKELEALMQNLFNVCFVVELVCRVVCDGWTYLLLRENHLDVFLVTLSTMLATLELISALSDADIQGVQTLRKLTVLRTLRLIKLAKAVRGRPEFKEMWSLLRGIGDSFETLFWTYVLIFCVLYFFGIMATVLIAKSDSFQGADAASELAQDLFGDVTRAMVTLFQVMTLDSWTSLMRPLMEVESWVSVFFIIFITVAVFLLMNLITAVIVENAFKTAQEDQVLMAQQAEGEKERELESLATFFKELDADGDETLTRAELDKARKDPGVRAVLRMFDLSPEDLNSVFELLNANGTGEIGCEEFVSGIRRLKGEPKAKDLFALDHECVLLSGYLGEVERICGASYQKLVALEAQMKTYKTDMERVRKHLGMMREVVVPASKTQRIRTPPESPRRKRHRRQARRHARAENRIDGGDASADSQEDMSSATASHALESQTTASVAGAAERHAQGGCSSQALSENSSRIPGSLQITDAICSSSPVRSYEGVFPVALGSNLLGGELAAGGLLSTRSGGLSARSGGHLRSPQRRVSFFNPTEQAGLLAASTAALIPHGHSAPSIQGPSESAATDSEAPELLSPCKAAEPLSPAWQKTKPKEASLGGSESLRPAAAAATGNDASEVLSCFSHVPSGTASERRVGFLTDDRED